MKNLKNKKKNWQKPDVTVLSVKNLTRTGDFNNAENGKSANSGTQAGGS